MSPFVVPKMVPMMQQGVGKKAPVKMTGTPAATRATWARRAIRGFLERLFTEGQGEPAKGETKIKLSLRPGTTDAHDAALGAHHIMVTVPQHVPSGVLRSMQEHLSQWIEMEPNIEIHELISEVKDFLQGVLPKEAGGDAVKVDVLHTEGRPERKPVRRGVSEAKIPAKETGGSKYREGTAPDISTYVGRYVDGYIDEYPGEDAEETVEYNDAKPKRSGVSDTRQKRMTTSTAMSYERELVSARKVAGKEGRSEGAAPHVRGRMIDRPESILQEADRIDLAQREMRRSRGDFADVNRPLETLAAERREHTNVSPSIHGLDRPPVIKQPPASILSPAPVIEIEQVTTTEPVWTINTTEIAWLKNALAQLGIANDTAPMPDSLAYAMSKIESGLLDERVVLTLEAIADRSLGVPEGKAITPTKRPIASTGIQATAIVREFMPTGENRSVQPNGRRVTSQPAYGNQSASESNAMGLIRTQIRQTPREGVLASSVAVGYALSRSETHDNTAQVAVGSNEGAVKVHDTEKASRGELQQNHAGTDELKAEQVRRSASGSISGEPVRAGNTVRVSGSERQNHADTGNESMGGRVHVQSEDFAQQATMKTDPEVGFESTLTAVSGAQAGQADSTITSAATVQPTWSGREVPTSREHVFQTVVETVERMRTPLTELEVELNPRELGHIRIQVREIRGNQIDVQITTTQEHTRELIQEQFSDIKSRLAESEIDVRRISAETATPKISREVEQGRHTDISEQTVYVEQDETTHRGNTDSRSGNRRSWIWNWWIESKRQEQEVF